MIVSAPRVTPGPASTIVPENVPVALSNTSSMLPSSTVPLPARSVIRLAELLVPLTSKVAPLATVTLE